MIGGIAMDLRIERTYRSLLTAFTELLETHRYEDVTVAMLCDAAMIRRTTFYKHFADKADFFAFFIDSLRMNLLKRGEGKAADGRVSLGRSVRGAGQVQPVEPAKGSAVPDASFDREGVAILRALVDFMLDHEAMVDNIFKSSMTGMMMLVMTDKVAEAVRERYAWVFRDDEEGLMTLEVGSEFAAGGIVRLIQLWWSSGHSKEGEQKLITMANELVVRSRGA